MNTPEIDKELFNYVLKCYIEGALLIPSITTRMARIKKSKNPNDIDKYITLGAVRQYITFLAIKTTEI